MFKDEEYSPLLLVCIHQDSCSLLDVGQCSSCGCAGIIVAPEEQNGLHVERDVNLQQLHIDIDGNIKGAYCTKCNVKALCDICGEEHRGIVKMSVEGEDKSVCPDCKGDYRICAICGKTHTIYNERFDKYICSSCESTITFCPTCISIVTSKDNLITFNIGTNEENFGCINCLPITECIWCLTNTNCKYIRDTGYLCSEHYAQALNLPHVEGYHHTKVNSWKHTPNEVNTKTYFGIENEVQILVDKDNRIGLAPIKKRMVAKQVKEIFPDTECKRDSSLNFSYRGNSVDGGVEMVWQPMSWGFIKDSRDKFNTMFTNVTKLLRKDMKQAGMHVHISKEAFTPLHFLKFTNFFYMASKKDFLEYVAGRGPNNYAKIRSAYSLKGSRIGVEYMGRQLVAREIATKGKRIKGMSSSHAINADRYDIINTTNEKTYEIRIFKGCRTFIEFMTRIQFVHAIFEYSRITSSKDLSLYTFFAFVTKHASTDYPELAKRIISYKKKMTKKLIAI